LCVVPGVERLNASSVDCLLQTTTTTTTTEEGRVMCQYIYLTSLSLSELKKKNVFVNQRPSSRVEFLSNSEKKKKKIRNAFDLIQFGFVFLFLCVCVCVLLYESLYDELLHLRCIHRQPCSTGAKQLLLLTLPGSSLFYFSHFLLLGGAVPDAHSSKKKKKLKDFL
jgi:hypothetical protein